MSKLSDFKRKKIEKTQNLIRDCAQQLFEKKGLHGVNFDEIAEAALISRSTLYKYYENKEAIFFDIHVTHVTQVIDFSQQFALSMTGKERILEMCDRLMTNFHDHWINSYVLNEFIKNNFQYDSFTQKSPDSSIKLHKLEDRFTTLQESIIAYFNFLLQFMHVWEQSIEVGKKDGSITNLRPISEMITYIRLYMVGIMDQSEISGLSPPNSGAKLSFDVIKQITLQNISHFLS